ncbi:MAG: beta strand repeat-containing protein [Acidimicrobiales bacterium]
MTKGRIGHVVAALVAVLSGVAAAGYFVDDALAASGPAAPSITSQPSNPTTSTSAAFTFTDSSSGVTFKCSLDSAAFVTCSSGVSYSSLAQGSHTFKVEAVLGSSTSSVTSYSWAIVPPTPTITSEPSNPTTATSASFKYSDTLAGVSFLCSFNGASFSSCASSGVTETVTTGGSNSFAVEAQVGSNTPSAAASYAWTVTTPTPTINSKPANPTNSTSATFTYSDSQAGDSFKCALDGASYSTCPSAGITYSGLSNATHTFGVEASLGSGPASSAASYSWLVHTTAPTITLTFPASGGWYNAAGWAAGCPTVGVCGTASDPVGVASVGVAVLQQSSGKYWNGSSFSSSSQMFNTATGTSSWDYPLARPADGTYTLYVRAADTLGNTTSSANLTTASFTIDTMAPAAPVLVGGGPSYDNPNDLTSPEFTFTDSSWPNVTFSCDLDSGTVMNCTGDTDHDGDPQVEGEWQFNNLAPGQHCFYVWATDKAGNVSPTTSYCWTVVGAPTNITEVSGSPQSATVHTAFANPLVAKVTDSHGDPVPGTSVTFSAPSSGASGTFSNGSTTITGTTGSNGEVSETFTANTTAGGPYTVKASVSGVSSPADFSLTNTPAAATKLVFSTQPPTSTAATSTFSTTVSIEDTYGNVETGDSSTVALSLSTNPCTGTLGGTTSKAATAGVATFSGLQVTKACTGYVLKATDATDGSISTTSSAFNITAGAATTIAVSSGSGQSATVHSAFAKPLVALVTDTYGNPVSGVTVTFKPPTSGASGTFAGGTNTAITNSSGLATSVTFTANTVAGTYNISAAASTTNTVQFSETNTAGAATTIAVSSGSAQSAPVSTAFGAPLVALVTDTYGNPVSGVIVTFTPPGSGASGTFTTTNTAVTGANGLATSTVFTANATAGGYSVSARAPTTNAVEFSETNTATVATAIAVYSGNNQSATVATSFGNALVAQLTASGNPIAGATVTFSAPTTGASGTFFAPCSGGNNATFTTCTVTSGAGGLAVSSTFTANTVAGGPYTVTATASGVATPADFSLTNTAGKASKLVFTTEPPASTPVASTFGASLTIEDAYGNTVTTDTNLVGLTLSTNTCDGSLGGTTTKAAMGGVVSFSNLQIVTACVGYQMTAMDGTDSLTSLPSNAFTITGGQATQLVFVQGPTNTTAGLAISPAVTVQAEDQYDNPVGDGGATVTIAVHSGPGGFTSSTTSVPTTLGGLGTFSNLVLDTAGNYTITASSSPLTPVTSGPFTVNAGPAYAINVVSGTPQTATQGQGFANPLVVKVTDQYNNTVSGASVKFMAPSSGASGTFSNSLDSITAPTLSDGTLSEGFTANDTGGPYTVTATTGALTPADFSLLNGMNFSITGNTSTAFIPGMTQPVDLSITNPNPSSDELQVDSSSLSLVVTPDAGHSGCQTSWFTLNQGSWSVTVQGGTTKALSDLGVAPGNLPTVTMTDTNTDQDACEGATLSLHWSANGNGAP